MRTLRLLAVLVVSVVAVAVSVAHASTRTGTGVVLHLKWRLLTQREIAITSNDRYTAILAGNIGPTISPTLTLLDEQTGKRRTLAPPSCFYRVPIVFGGPWLVLGCDHGSYKLYQPATRQWRNLTPSPQCPNECTPIAVGRDWLKLDSMGPPHTLDTYYLQNIYTGALKPDPVKPGGTHYDDLNSPAGVRPLCSPLRYPTSEPLGYGATAPGLLSFDGGYSLAREMNSGNGRGILQRCGTRRRVIVGGDAGFSSRAVAWIDLTRGRGIFGRYLAGLQRFTIIHPPNGGLLALSRRTIYLGDGGQLWAAALPPAPRHRRTS